MSNQGDNATDLFSGDVEHPTLKQLYTESAPYIAQVLRIHLPNELQTYTLLDVGAYQGELLTNILAELKGTRKLNITAIDANAAILEENKTTKMKVAADIVKMPFIDKSFDFSITRYVLQWNTLERQKQIVKEIARVSKLALIQHAGADSEKREVWQERLHTMLTGTIPSISRNECYFSSAQEIESFLLEQHIPFQKLQHRKVEQLSEVYIQKYNLSEGDAKKVKEMLGDMDYIYQTTWLIGDDKLM